MYRDLNPLRKILRDPRVLRGFVVKNENSMEDDNQFTFKYFYLKTDYL